MDANFSKNLRKLLKDKGISQRKLSEKSKVPISTINSILSRKAKKPDTPTIDAICSALNVTDYFLLYGVDAFNMQTFEEVLAKKHISLENLVIEGVCNNPQLICRSIMPPITEQDKIAKFLEMDRADVFVPHYAAVDFLNAFNINRRSFSANKCLTPSIQEFDNIFDKLNDSNKNIVYNLARDLLKCELEELL